jgi:hypothetical protein
MYEKELKLQLEKRELSTDNIHLQLHSPGTNDVSNWQQTYITLSGETCGSLFYFTNLIQVANNGKRLFGYSATLFYLQGSFIV